MGQYVYWIASVAVALTLGSIVGIAFNGEAGTTVGGLSGIVAFIVLRRWYIRLRRD